MNGVRLWWSVLICVIAVAGFVRFEERQAVSVERADSSLSEPIRALLLASHATELSEIRRGPRRSGFQFRYQGCAEPMKVVVLSITHLADSFVQHYAAENHRYRFQYLDFDHQGSSRVLLTGIWAWNRVKNALRRSPYRGSAKQIAILWPASCEAPAIDWSVAWRHSRVDA